MTSRFVHRTFGEPDSFEAVELARTDFVTLDGVTFRRLTFEPGFRASVHMKRAMGIETCPFPHVMVSTSGRGVFRMLDGTEHPTEPWQIIALDAGHDFWVVGDEPAVFIEPTVGALP